MRSFSLLALDSYLKCAASKCSHEVLGMAADDDFVEVEVVGSTHDLAVRVCLRLVNPVKMSVR
jgi:hypothetical protein